MEKPIKVSEKALAHLSRGLYRSPASALRELVSNAWDANATYVRIDTNHPVFTQLSVEDNGEGFTLDEFERIMDGGIGDSRKRPLNEALINNRPIIGRLGVGMLGIAQICGAFTITSKKEKGEAFKARVHLYDLLKDRLDAGDQEIIGEQEIDVGTYEVLEYDGSLESRGTKIIADDVHPTFVRTFRESLSYEEYSDPPINDWGKLVKQVSTFHSLQELGDYWRLIWELAAACPIPYNSEDALPNNLIEDEQNRLLNYGFKVIVDGIELKKPVILSGNPGGYTTEKITPQDHTVYGKLLSFHGYLIVQEGTQLKPDELRGIMTRIKNVGIGYYDQTLLDYRINQGPRTRWITGEIFVDEGLENALNIDRDSFNRFHPEYRALQKEIHILLQNVIFPETYRKIDARSRERNKQRKVKRQELFQQVLEDVTNKKISIQEAKKPKEESIAPEIKAKVSESTESVDIVVPDPESLKTKKPYQDLASALLGIFELAMIEEDPSKRREIFTDSIINLLKGW